MHRHRTNHHRRRQHGFTIIEVLVAMVVLSIGLLGIAKLMLFASRSNDSAYLRSQATELAYEILDDMRANRAAAVSHAYDTTLGVMPGTPGTCLVTTACSSSSLALYDVYTWKQRLAASSAPAPGLLPAGTGSVVTTTTVTSPTVTTATITVQWDDQAAQSSFAGAPVGTAAPMTITLETIL